MRIACLIPDEAVYASACTKLIPRRFECRRHADDGSLLNSLARTPADAVIADFGFDRAMEDRFLLWIGNASAQRPPVLLQTSDPRAERTAHALLMGVDDVVLRGVEAVELAARLNVVSRRRASLVGCDESDRIDIGDYHFDRAAARATIGQQPVCLTTREFALAWLLFSNAGNCLSRRAIGTVVWGGDSDISDRSMEQHIHRLRRKLALHEAARVSIRTIYGKGYRLTVDPAITGASLTHAC